MPLQKAKISNLHSLCLLKLLTSLLSNLCSHLVQMSNQRLPLVTPRRLLDPKARPLMRSPSAQAISMRDRLILMITKVMMMGRILKKGIKRGKLRFGVGKREEGNQIRINQDQDRQSVDIVTDQIVGEDR